MLLVSVLPGSNFSCLALLPNVSATTARALPLVLLAQLLVSPPLPMPIVWIAISSPCFFASWVPTARRLSGRRSPEGSRRWENAIVESESDCCWVAI